MYFHVYLIYRFTRTFTDHSSVITRCWGFELQNGKSSLKSPQTLATQDFAPASFLSTPDRVNQDIRFGCPDFFVRRKELDIDTHARSAIGSEVRQGSCELRNAIRGMPGSEFEPRSPLQKRNTTQWVVFLFWSGQVCFANLSCGGIKKQGKQAIRRQWRKK